MMYETNTGFILFPTYSTKFVKSGDVLVYVSPGLWGGDVSKIPGNAII